MNGGISWNNGKDAQFVETAEKVEALIGEGKVCSFVGRPTCPYCRRFAPKLTKCVAIRKKKMYFINSRRQSQRSVSSSKEIQYANSTWFISCSWRVVCDSSKCGTNQSLLLIINVCETLRESGLRRVFACIK